MKQKLKGAWGSRQQANSYSSILDIHQQFLQQELYQLETQTSWEGLLQDKLIQHNAHVYLSYSLFLQRTTEDLLKRPPVQPVPPGQRPKATFQIIPQLTFKTRCLTFGKEQMTELTKWLLDSEQHKTHMERLLSGIQFADNVELKHDLKEMEEKQSNYQTALQCIPRYPNKEK